MEFHFLCCAQLQNIIIYSDASNYLTYLEAKFWIVLAGEMLFDDFCDDESCFLPSRASWLPGSFVGSEVFLCSDSFEVSRKKLAPSVSDFSLFACHAYR